MLCSACTDIFRGKRTRWLGSHRKTVDIYSSNRLEVLSDMDWNEPLTSDWSGKFRSEWEAEREDEWETETESEPETDPENWKTWERFGANDAHLRGRREQYIHHPTSQQFVSAASKGCQLCTMFLAQLSEKDRNTLAQGPMDIDARKKLVDYPTTYEIKNQNGFGRGSMFRSVSWSLHGYYMAPTENGTDRKIHYSVRFGGRRMNGKHSRSPERQHLANNARGQTPLLDPEVPLSHIVGEGDSSLSLVRKWITACEETHETCKLRSLPNARDHNQGSTFARILDVLGDYHSMNLQLRDAEDVPANALYMTLSRTLFPCHIARTMLTIPFRLLG
jgi:hypothetical protein